VSTLTWGILGAASIATEKVIPAIQRAANSDVIAIGSRRVESAVAASERLGIPTAYAGYEAVLEDERVEAVYIPLPNHLHAEWTLAAAAAGKHVLCEKPLALSAADAQEMVDACADAGVAFMEAFMYRMHPSWVLARELIDAGRVGAIRTVHSWFSYFNDDPQNIRNIKEAGGGALMDIGCYSVNLSRMLLAAEPTGVHSVMTRDAVSDVDTTTTAILEFGDKQASFTCSMRSEPDQYVSIYGDEGRIRIETPFNMPWDRPTRVLVTRGGEVPAGEPKVIEVPPASAYTVQAELFAAAVLDGQAVPTAPTDGVANMRVIERIINAARRS
jgi:predicted dehydrogenase